MMRGVIIVGGALVALCASAAAATRGGNGLYEPFPGGALKQRATDYARRIQAPLPTTALTHGSFTAAGRALLAAKAGGSADPARGAGLGVSSKPSLGWPLALAVVATALGLLEWARRGLARA